VLIEATVTFYHRNPRKSKAAAAGETEFIGKTRAGTLSYVLEFRDGVDKQTIRISESFRNVKNRCRSDGKLFCV